MDALVGSALLVIVFMGMYAAFQLSIDVVTNNKARAAAIALANERMEYVRSLTYSLVGTSGGIPSGSIAQNESITYNGINFTRRTFIQYADDPVDGTGASDTNGIIADYKIVKIDVYWTSHNRERHITIVTRVTPTNGVETAVSGGTLTINTVNSAGTAVPNAEIHIVNSSVSPAVDLTTYSNASGTASFIGAVAGSGYQITVSKTGYSTAQTYSATSQNTSPNPGHLSISNNVTTSATFAIDLLSSRTIRTYTQVASTTWSDTFTSDASVATTSNVLISGGVARIDGAAPFSSGSLQSIAIGPASLYGWKTLSWSDSKPAGTSIVYRVYDATGSTLIPDSQLPGNSAGFTSSGVDLSSISTSTYSSLRIGAALTGSVSTTSAIDSWSVSYDYGAQPLPNIAFSILGAKTIGSGPSGTIYKYDSNFSSGSNGSVDILNLEWDTYTITVNGTSTSYDIAQSCNPQPESLAAASTLTTNLFLAAHTVNSLLVDVRSATSSALIPNASVGLSRSGYAATSTTSACGQVFFPGLTSGSYTITVMKSGYTTYNATGVIIGGTSKRSVVIN